MKLERFFKWDEPNECNMCYDQYNGSNCILLTIKKGIKLRISVCDKCLKILKEN